MIILNTQKTEIYCKIIHNYLEAEIFGDSEIDIGDVIEVYMPKYLFREQYQRCIEVFKDLYEWTDDLFLHELTAFHEVALYYFLTEMSNIKEDMQEDFEKVYYDKKLKIKIKEYAKKDKEDIFNLMENYKRIEERDWGSLTNTKIDESCYDNCEVREYNLFAE